jgi:hypothetical protein
MLPTLFPLSLSLSLSLYLSLSLSLSPQTDCKELDRKGGNKRNGAYSFHSSFLHSSSPERLFLAVKFETELEPSVPSDCTASTTRTEIIL